MACVRYGPALIHISEEYEPGSQPPSGYMAKWEWAMAQMKAGLKQRKCRGCGKYLFPQERHTHTTPPPARPEGA